MCMCYGLTTDILTTKNLLSKRDSISNQICVYNLDICTYRAHSFTSLMADLRQDINGGFAFSRGA